MPSNGLMGVGALGQGLSSFFSSYRDEKRYRQEQERNDRKDKEASQHQADMLALAMHKSGLMDPNQSPVPVVEAPQAEAPVEPPGLLKAAAMDAAPQTPEAPSLGVDTSVPQPVAPQGLMNRTVQSSNEAPPARHYGRFVETPEAMAAQQLSTKKTQQTSDSLDPNSAYSQSKREETRGLLKNINPKLAGAITDKMSAADIESNKMLQTVVNGENSVRVAKAKQEKPPLQPGQSSPEDIKSSQASYDKLQSDGVYKKAKDQAAEANTLKGLLVDATTNPASANAAKIYAARYSTGGQRINKQEIEALGGSKAVGAHLEQIAKTAVDGTLSPDNARFMSKFIDVTSNSINQNMEHAKSERAEDHKKIHGKYPLWYTKEASTTEAPKKKYDWM